MNGDGKADNENIFNDGSKWINRIKCKSISEYLVTVDEVNEVVEFDNDMWFRGHVNIDFNLIPSIYRKETWTYTTGFAKNITNEFINKGRKYLSGIDNSNWWEWYHIMQHYGLPTRLLDWTEGSLIGLYFAVRNPFQQKNACVWILSPEDLNSKSTEQNAIYFTNTITQDKLDRIIDKYKDEENLPDLPIAINPAYIDERMKVQKSCFTIHGKEQNGFSELKSRNGAIKIAQIRIDRGYLHKIKRDLYNCGISEETLFPDLEGLARGLRFKFDMDLRHNL